jgi:hypothetical protein
MACIARKGALDAGGELEAEPLRALIDNSIVITPAPVK